MRFAKNLMFFLALVLIAAWVDDFHTMLERHHWDRKPLTELNVTDKEPQSVEGMLIDTHCPHQRGELGEFLKCREEKKRLYRKDI